MAFRSFAHWTGPGRARAERVVTRLCCIGELSTDDLADLRCMKDLRDLTLEGISTFPAELCELVQLHSLTVNKRGEDGITEIPAEIGNLHALRTLRIRARNLTKLPESIADLHALVDLDLRHSGVRKLPDRVMEVPNLRRIFVHAD
jgi:Leucine-rich repeat (LRR) protein